VTRHQKEKKSLTLAESREGKLEIYEKEYYYFLG